MGDGRVDAFEPNVDDHGREFQEVIDPRVAAERMADWEAQAPCPAGDAVPSETEGASVGPTNPVGLSRDDEVNGNSCMHSEQDLFPEFEVFDGLFL